MEKMNTNYCDILMVSIKNQYFFYVHCYYVVVGLNEFMKIVDDRFSNKQAKSPASGLVAKKE